MKKKRITNDEARELIKRNIFVDSLGSYGLRKFMEIIPFSWHIYCKDNNLNPNLLMDDHEKIVRRGERRDLKLSQTNGSTSK